MAVSRPNNRLMQEDLNYRKLSYKECQELITRFSEDSKINEARNIIKQYYGSAAYKCFIKANSEYNDEGYDTSVVIIVLDELMNELDSKGGGSSSLEYLFYPKSDNEDNEDEPEDYTFLVEDDQSIPELYVKNNA